MPPKKIFTEEQIIDAAFIIADEFGFDSITIRKIATILNSSIAPIYVSFKNLDELKKTLAKKIMDSVKEIIVDESTEDPFLDIGAGNIRYALAHPLLYKDYMLNSNCRRYFANIKHDPNLYLQKMRKSPKLKDFNLDELGEILNKMRIFTSGIIFEVLAEKLTSDYNSIIELLYNVGDDIIAAQKLKFSDTTKYKA